METTKGESPSEVLRLCPWCESSSDRRSCPSPPPGPGVGGKLHGNWCGGSWVTDVWQCVCHESEGQWLESQGGVSGAETSGLREFRVPEQISLLAT